MRQLNKEVLENLRSNPDLILAIAKGMFKEYDTVNRWAKNNNRILTSDAVVLIIQKETGLSEEEIVDTESVSA